MSIFATEFTTGWCKKPRPLATVSQRVPNISAGSVVTCFRCGGILNDQLLVVTNLLLRLAVKEL